ncbi:MAG: hypothetical protein ACI83P_000264 [Janthinobacterium sp.]|jgi:hypothetical protein
MYRINVIHHSTKAFMFSIAKKLSQVTKSVFDEQLFGFTKLVEAVIDSGMGVVEINVDAIKTSTAAAAVASNQFLRIQNSSDLLSLMTAQSQQTLEHVNAYGRQVVDTTRDAQARFLVLGQSGPEASDHKVVKLIGIVQKDEARIIATKSISKNALDDAHGGYDNPVPAGKKVKAGSAIASAVSPDVDVTRRQVRAKDGPA